VTDGLRPIDYFRAGWLAAYGEGQGWDWQPGDDFIHQEFDECGYGYRSGSVVQRSERITHNDCVAGSSPARPTEVQ
jgi:hypothetical protein